MFMGVNHQEIKSDQDRSTTFLASSDYDFSAKYLAICHLNELAVKQPETIGPETIDGLENVFYDPKVSDQTQAYFFFREAAGALCSLLARLPHDARAHQSHNAFMNLLGRTTGHAQRAVAEALGALPFSISGTAPEKPILTEAPVVSWRKFLECTQTSTEGTPRFMGRSVVAKTALKDRLLVVKLAGEGDNPESLLREAAWLHHLQKSQNNFTVKFHIPEPLSVQNGSLFRLLDLPDPYPYKKKRHEMGYAISFLAHPDYFRYPNETDPKKQLDANTFLETIRRNAFLFGRLTGMGIIHEAPVPLFHNRVQGPRRNDGGVYLWQQGGRLDQWLWSCRYPNFGCSGIRDFEHLTVFRGPARKAYSSMGAQLLSLFLVAGSYFRMRDIQRVGLGPDGRPVDARELFEKPLLVKILESVFHHFYGGFVGKPFKGALPLDFSRLANRMVDEMGVDRHMEEILRVADQQEMTHSAFIDFLVQRRVSKAKALEMKKGVNDITLYTGPHLGGFNQPISLPELIESVGSMVALCIYGRYCEEKLN